MGVYGQETRKENNIWNVNKKYPIKKKTVNGVQIKKERNLRATM